MQKMIFLLAWLLPAPSCSAQILIPPNPQALSYMFLAGQPPRAVISPLTSEENGKFQQVYSAALQGNSTLDAAGDALSAKIDAYRKLLIAAMIKADPKIEPLLGTQAGTPLTDAQRNEILQAQAEAMQTDPNLQSSWDDLTKKMTTHQQEVDAAMLKLDPTMAEILAKFSP